MRTVRLRRMPPVRRGTRARRCVDQPVPAGGRCDRHGACPLAGNARRTARSRLWRSGTEGDGTYRRKRVHRMHGVHPRLSGGCNHRCAQVDARSDRERVHGMRPVRRAMPGGLYFHGSDTNGSDDGRGMAGRARAVRAAPLRATARSGIGAGCRTASAGAGRADRCRRIPANAHRRAAAGRHRRCGGSGRGAQGAFELAGPGEQALNATKRMSVFEQPRCVEAALAPHGSGGATRVEERGP